MEVDVVGFAFETVERNVIKWKEMRDDLNALFPRQRKKLKTKKNLRTQESKSKALGFLISSWRDEWRKYSSSSSRRGGGISFVSSNSGSAMIVATSRLFIKFLFFFFFFFFFFLTPLKGGRDKESKRNPSINEDVWKRRVYKLTTSLGT